MRERFPGVRLSIGNSAGILTGAGFGCDLARPGIGLYGGSPWAERPNPMQPVATLEAQVVQVRTVGAGEAIGYGASWTAERPTVVAVLGIGYADGPTSAAVQLRRSGRQQSPLPAAGSRVHGPHGHRRYRRRLGRGRLGGSVRPQFACWDEVAAKANTIAYEILTGISPRG